MNLTELYEKLIAEGCNHFYIEGIGGQMQDNVTWLGRKNGKWEVYYMERGNRSEPIFSTDDIDKAIEYYHDYILNHVEHWHLITFTRSKKTFNALRDQLEEHGIRTIQNDIPHYQFTGDNIYRLFVAGKDIFKANGIFEIIPYFDDDLKR